MLGSDRHGVRPSRRCAASSPADWWRSRILQSQESCGQTDVTRRESAQEAVRRFRKLVERSGIKKEMRVREFYEKPSETKRRARLRAQRRARRERFFATH